MTTSNLQTFVVHLEDLPGVLNRVSSLFRNRGHNIVSLNLAQTHTPGVSRMTVVIESDEDQAKRLGESLDELVNVLSVHNLAPEASVVLDMALVKVNASPENRAQVLELCESSRARVVDVGSDTLVVEVTGSQEKVAALIDSLAEFGISEMVKSGPLAMARGALPETEYSADNLRCFGRRFGSA